MITYVEYCKTKCEWCAKGYRHATTAGLPSHPVAEYEGWHGRYSELCTAPSRDQFEQELQGRIAKLTDALGMIYDKWENGDSCYENPEDFEGYMGKAFQLSYKE